jgi:hypothetical protein
VLTRWLLGGHISSSPAVGHTLLGCPQAANGPTCAHSSHPWFTRGAPDAPGALCISPRPPAHLLGACATVSAEQQPEQPVEPPCDHKRSTIPPRGVLRGKLHHLDALELLVLLIGAPAGRPRTLTNLTNAISERRRVAYGLWRVCWCPPPGMGAKPRPMAGRTNLFPGGAIRPEHSQDTPRTRVLALAYSQVTPRTRVLPTL